MPIYEYSCKACEASFEEIRKMTDDTLPECPECKSSEVKKMVSATAFHLKGGGWYKDGYASTPKTNSTSSADVPKPKESAKTDTKAEKASTSTSKKAS